jgi:hypothetical protein
MRFSRRSLHLVRVELAAVVLRQPHLNEIGRDGVSLLGVSTPDLVRPDLAADLQLELRTVPPVGISG